MGSSPIADLLTSVDETLSHGQTATLQKAFLLLLTDAMKKLTGESPELPYLLFAVRSTMPHHDERWKIKARLIITEMLAITHRKKYAEQCLQIMNFLPSTGLQIDATKLIRSSEIIGPRGYLPTFLCLVQTAPASAVDWLSERTSPERGAVFETAIRTLLKSPHIPCFTLAPEIPRGVSVHALLAAIIQRMSNDNRREEFETILLTVIGGGEVMSQNARVGERPAHRTESLLRDAKVHMTEAHEAKTTTRLFSLVYTRDASVLKVDD
ncbi:hypothetical protein GCM10027020_34830 [Nocardioides salsibiostraticola]